MNVTACDHFPRVNFTKIVYSKREYRIVDNIVARLDETEGRRTRCSKRKLSGAPEGRIWFIFSILTMVYIELERVYVM